MWRAKQPTWCTVSWLRGLGGLRTGGGGGGPGGVLEGRLSAHRLSVSQKECWGVLDVHRLGGGGCLTPLRYRLDHRGPLCSAHTVAIKSQTQQAGNIVFTAHTSRIALDRSAASQPEAVRPGCPS